MYIVRQDPTRYTAYPIKAGLVLSCIQIILGILSIVLQTIIIVNSPVDHYGGTGYYCGFMFVLAGGLGVGASKTSGGRCLVISTMVMSIMAAVFSTGQVAASSVGVIVTSDDWRYYGGHYEKRNHDPSIAMISVLLVLAFIEFIVAIVQSAMCCRGCCCGPAGQPYYAVSPQQVVVGGGMGGQVAPSAPMSVVQLPNGQMVQLPNGQMAMIINAGTSMPLAGALAPAANPVAAVPPTYQEKAAE